MLLTETKGKSLLEQAGIRTPAGFLAHSPDDCARIDRFPVAVKAQVSSGGRGLSGGIAKATSMEEARAAVKRILATEFAGVRPESVLVESWLQIERELYLSVAVDGRAGGYVILYSPRGGVAIEQGSPPARYEVGAPSGFRGHALRSILADAEPYPAVRERVISLARRLLRIAVSHDCLTVEINPLAVLLDGSLVAADAKVVLDDSAAFRNAETASAVQRSREAEPPAIARALNGKLMLVWLDGEVGLISGGAGMTMAAMDLITDAGGRPACFLDCSNNPTPAGYGLAFEFLDEQPSVNVILVTIFGGLTQMERVARVMRDIMQSRKSNKPVVFRLNGTNAEKADEIFRDASLTNYPSLEDAVKIAVRIAQEGRKPA